MKVGIISLHNIQYLRKAEDLQWPWAITMKGSMPRRSKCVVPQILKLCPEVVVRPLESHTSLHLSRNQDLCIGKKCPDIVSNPKIWLEGGTQVLIAQ